MSKFQVNTLSGSFVFDAEDAEQARRLGKDGGRIVVSVDQLPDDESEQTEGETMAGAPETAPVTDAATDGETQNASPGTAPESVTDTLPSDFGDANESDFGDEDIVVIPRSEYDRLVGLARLSGYGVRDADTGAAVETTFVNRGEPVQATPPQDDQA